MMEEYLRKYKVATGLMPSGSSRVDKDLAGNKRPEQQLESTVASQNKNNSLKATGFDNPAYERERLGSAESGVAFSAPAVAFHTEAEAVTVKEPTLENDQTEQTHTLTSSLGTIT